MVAIHLQFYLDWHQVFVYLKIISQLRDRLAAGRRVLAPLTQVRILVPQPNNKKDYGFF